MRNQVLAIFKMALSITIFTSVYLVLVLIGLGQGDLLVWMLLIILMASGVRNFIESIQLWNKEGEKEYAYDKPNLYYVLKQDSEGMWQFALISMNHEIICVSDEFTTKGGCLTGLVYLMHSIQSFDITKIEQRDSKLLD